MAAPSYATDLVDVNASAESTTSWSALGGGGAGLSADPDFAIEGTNSMTKQVSGNGTTKGMIYDFGSTRTQGADDHIYQWIYCTTPGLLDVLSGGGLRVTIGTGTGAYNDYYVAGSDTYNEGGWKCFPIRYTTGTPSPGAQTGSPGSAPQWFGGQADMTGTVKAVNFSVDVAYEGHQIDITAGDVTTPGTWERLTTWSYDTTRRYGVVLPIDGGAAVQGQINWGTTGASVYVRDSGKLITFPDTPHSLTDLSEIVFNHASSDIEMLGMTFLSLGTNNPGRIITGSTNPPVDLSGSTFDGLGLIEGRDNTTYDGSTFVRCDEVIPLVAPSMLNCTFDSPNVAADEAALVWNIATNPSGKIDGSTFIKNTGVAHHAIEFGTSAPTTITLDCTFSGFSGSGTSATLNFLRTSGNTTLNYTGTLPTYQTTGTHTVTPVQTTNLTVNVDQDINTEVRVYDAGTTTAVAGIETIGATKTWTTAIDSATYSSVDVHIISKDYIIERRTAVDMSSGAVTIDIQQRSDPQFDNPT